VRAIIHIDAGDLTQKTTVLVENVVSAGILISDTEGDEIDEKLIPWHRVWEITSNVEGELYLETGR
jgi:hypothetical protein